MTDLSRLTPRHRPGLVGGVVPQRPAPGDLGRLPRRDRPRRLRLHRARPAGLHAAGPGAARGRAGRSAASPSAAAPSSPGSTRAPRRWRRRRRLRSEAKLLAALGAEYLVHLPEQYTDSTPERPPKARRHRPRAVEEPRHRHRRAGPVSVRSYGVKLVFHPHVDTHVDTQDADRAVPVRHRPGAGQPLPGHRARRLLRGRQPRDHRALPRADHLRAPQVGRPRGPRAGCSRRSSRSPRAVGSA